MKLDENLFEEYDEYEDVDPECVRDGMVAVMCDCGYEDIIPLDYYDGCCPRCHGHTGEYGPVPFDEFNESLTEAYDTDIVAEILSGYIPMPKKGFKYLSNNGTSGEVVFKGIKYAFREKDDGSYKVMRSSDAGSNWSETLFKDESLTEDIDDVVVVDVPDVITDVTQEEITPKGPEIGQDTGVANLILDLINSENSTITDYNNFIANITDSHPEFISVISDIANEENNHVGMLTQLLKQVSPNAKTIEQGELEAEKDLFSNSIEEETVDFDVDDSFDNGFGGIFL